MSKKIMVVDDNVDIVETLSSIVRAQGYQVATADNGQAFLADVENQKPDLVLLDVMMPGLATKDILAQLASKSVHPPVVLVTVVRFSQAEIETLQQNKAIVGYIAKPFDLKTIVELLQKA